VPEVATSVPATAGAPRSGRLARTRARARWPEYGPLLADALQRGYRVISLERFVADPPADDWPLLVLRHDVDQHPRSALKMAAIERAAGVSSTWYFRWRTADARVIGRLRADGFDVGLHYETLTRRLLAMGRGIEAVDRRLLESCRDELRSEIDSFVDRFGPIASVCPHGDTRVPGVHNGVLLKDQPPADFRGMVDCNEAMRGRELAAWLTDRSVPDGRWGGGLDPAALIEARTTPMLCLTHPNNWAGGAGLLLDRMIGAALPSRFPPVPIRTRRDTPPRPGSDTPPAASSDTLGTASA
jgi:hypothetical protein